jgi:hypothetical protein
MNKVVISQSMYFPWVGLLEQVRLADVFIHYDDVQLSRGFYNRVQIKNSSGVQWLTIPLRDRHQGQLISDTKIDNGANWQKHHIEILRHAYRRAPYFSEMLELAETVFSKKTETLGDIARESVLALCRYFEIDKSTRFVHSVDLNIIGLSSQRLCDLCLAVGGKIYITGHGAIKYLDYELFERSNIKVEYMKYQMLPYPQLHGEFTPYVSGLDLVANCGKEGCKNIISESIYWKDFLK